MLESKTSAAVPLQVPYRQPWKPPPKGDAITGVRGCSKVTYSGTMNGSPSSVTRTGHSRNPGSISACASKKTCSPAVTANETLASSPAWCLSQSLPRVRTLKATLPERLVAELDTDSVPSRGTTSGRSGIGSKRPCNRKYGSAMKLVEDSSVGSGVRHTPDESQTVVMTPVGLQTMAAGSMGSSVSMRKTSESPAWTWKSALNGVRPTKSEAMVVELTSKGEPQKTSVGRVPKGNLCAQTRTSSAVVACLSTSPETWSVPEKAGWTEVSGLPASLKSAAVLNVKSGAPVGSTRGASSAVRAPQSPVQDVYWNVGEKVISSSGTGRGGLCVVSLPTGKSSSVDRTK